MIVRAPVVATPAGERRGGRRALRLLALAGLTCTGLLLGAGAARAAAQSTVEIPVAFQVKNTDTSQSPCDSGLPNGATYTIRGHISGPQAALASGMASRITVYLFGYEAGEWNWDLKGVPGYDYAAEMAKQGQVSLTLDELGYGTSGHPANGNETCQGAEADIAHQIIQKLRGGGYTPEGAPGIKFSTVVLAGHDIGGEVAEIEAYSFHDIDGLMLVSWADQGFTKYIIKRAAVVASQTCGESASGYVHFISDQEFRTLFTYNMEPRVIKAVDALRSPNPCGIIRSSPPSVPIDKTHLAQITVPVLIVFGDNDEVVYERKGEEEQQGDFSGSRDKSTEFIPEAGHLVMFAKTGPLYDSTGFDSTGFDSTMSKWLTSRFPMP
jgi:pimeloyl-ACP methyl ester carboxylesterase